MPADIIKKFEKQYGKKKGKSIYYATAKKHHRNPETFHKEDKATKFEQILNEKLQSI